ncbi:MAG: asparaginase [Patescibacteria group bacterium]|nr:asparaginase [Patescibacteria group bacterium]
MKKILILFCGGTLAMKRDNRGNLSPYYESKDLIKRVPHLSEIAAIDIENIVNIDSSNFQPEIWTEIAIKIADNISKYEGFIIIHGTDTMAYTASALSFALLNLGKPVVLTGGQKPMDDIGTDGINNLINAVLVINYGIPDIYIVFGTKILKGNRATKISESSLDAFDSVMRLPLGEIALEPKLFIKEKKTRSQKLKLKPKFEPDIVIFDLFPGFRPKYLDEIIESQCKGVILKSFGSGNIPDNFISLIGRANQKDLPVVIISQCYKGLTQMQLYEVGQNALNVGAIPGRDMTLEAASTKLMWGLANYKAVNKIRKLFNTNIAGEVTISN